MDFKCFDVVSSVVEEANERFAPLWKMDEEKYDILENYCEVIDKLIEDSDGISFDVEVDEIKMTIAVEIETADVVITDRKSPVYELFKRAISAGFRQSEEGNVITKFVFPSIWEKA